MFDKHDCISPIDYRYWDGEVAHYLSENGFTRAKLKVELSLVKILARRGICPEEVVGEVEKACGEITTAEVYAEEKRIGHDIRALVNCIRNKVSEKAKPFVHMTATSFDISDTANAVRFKDCVEKILIPSLLALETVLVRITLREMRTMQIGRTHGQHAVPISFGFAIAEYVSRLGGSIKVLKTLTAKLPGKFSGAVGAYNASSLFFGDPEDFEAEVLAELGLISADHSTQIVPPEAFVRLLSESVIAAGVLANLARDMRNLQRTEIGEVGEEFDTAQVGSSTMPQKQNPINFENVESMHKIVSSRVQMVLQDQISEHQRDLTNSASARTYGEIIAYVVSMTKRMTRTMENLGVNHVNLKKNLALQKGLVLAEPLYIILAFLGHPNAHEKVKILTVQARKEGVSLEEVVARDGELVSYLEKMSPQQRSVLSDPSLYTGIASEKVQKVARHWKQELGL